MPEAVAVTGAGGYIGGAVAAALEAAGRPVRRLSRAGKFSLESPPSAAELAALGAGALVHCAYDFGPLRWEDVRRVNVEGSLRLFRAAREAGVRRFVFVSSLAAHGGSLSLYGRGKKVVEAEVLAGGGAVVRPGTVYGRRPGGVMGALARQAAGARLLPVVRHPGPVFMAHESDLARLVLRLLDSPSVPGRPLFAAGRKPWTLRDLVRSLAASAGKPCRTLPVPWRAAWAGAKLLELCGLRPPFRSDSVLSLGSPAPAEELAALEPPPTLFREFDPREVRWRP